MGGVGICCGRLRNPEDHRFCLLLLHRIRVLSHSQSDVIRTAYLYYYATMDSTPNLQQRIQGLINDALILAKKVRSCQFLLTRNHHLSLPPLFSS